MCEYIKVSVYIYNIRFILFYTSRKTYIYFPSVFIDIQWIMFSFVGEFISLLFFFAWCFVCFCCFFGYISWLVNFCWSVHFVVMLFPSALVKWFSAFICQIFRLYMYIYIRRWNDKEKEVRRNPIGELLGWLAESDKGFSFSGNKCGGHMIPFFICCSLLRKGESLFNTKANVLSLSE